MGAWPLRPGLPLAIPRLTGLTRSRYYAPSLCRMMLLTRPLPAHPPRKWTNGGERPTPCYLMLRHLLQAIKLLNGVVKQLERFIALAEYILEPQLR